MRILGVILLPLAGAFPRALRSSGRDFVSDSGRVVRLHAGEMHYFRVPEIHWEDRLQRLRAMGLNAVSTYVPWNWHEAAEGSFDFSSDRKDVVRFLRLARQQDLLVIFRPGPYICAEWDFGGLPAWLLGRAMQEGFNLRTGDQKYLAFVDRFWDELLPRVKPELLENGGSVAAIQLENEYGHWGDANQPSDRAYFEHLRKLVRRHLGPSVLLITTDDDEAVAQGRGGLPDVLAAVNIGPWQEDVRKHLEKVFGNARLHNGDAPELVMELWSGWFQMWQHDDSAKKQFQTPGGQLLDYVKALLDRNASFTLYMAHGGTNFGFWPSAGFTMPEFGSSIRWHSAFVSTSYDYAAPIAEDGARLGRHGLGSDGVDKYGGLRNLLARHRGMEDPPLPEEPSPPALTAYPGAGHAGEVPMRRKASLRDPAALEVLRSGGAPALVPQPRAMELHGQQGGMVLYRYHPADPAALGHAIERWHAEGSGREPRFWPRVVVALLAAVAGATFLWRCPRCCRCCSVCAVFMASIAFNVHDRWSQPDQAPLVLRARDRVTVWQGDTLVQRPHLNLEHVCCPWQILDLAVSLAHQGSGSLDVLVENLGRRAFMPRHFMGEAFGLRDIWYDWKGLVGARIGSAPLPGQWETFALPLADLHGLNGSAPAQSLGAAAGSGPTFFEGEFFAPEEESGLADSYLRFEAGPWQTGVAYINGFNLGRYWRGAAAPLGLYVPKSLFRRGRNALVLLEMEPVPSDEGASVRFEATRG
uniref:Beta-galactosidase n=1 Tax=Alexandrium monilatum TaxID=311494 RepID=A0A7S4UYG2_9DINO